MLSREGRRILRQAWAGAEPKWHRLWHVLWPVVVGWMLALWIPFAYQLGRWWGVGVGSVALGFDLLGWLRLRPLMAERLGPQPEGQGSDADASRQDAPEG